MKNVVMKNVAKKKVIKLYELSFTVKGEIFLIHKYVESSKQVKDIIDNFKKYCRNNCGFNPDVLSVLDLSHISIETNEAIRRSNTILCF